MVDLNIGNVITIGIISIGAIALAKAASNRFGWGASWL